MRRDAPSVSLDTVLACLLCAGGVAAALLLAIAMAGCASDEPRAAELRALYGLSGIHVPFKLKGKGDDVHLLVGGAEADFTTWGMTDVPSGKSWARLPDGTGAFATATPTKLATNVP